MSVVLVVALLAAVTLGISEARRWATGDTVGARMLRTLTLMVWHLLKALIWLWATACRMAIGEFRSW